MAWTTPQTWTTGEVVTSSTMNTQVRDNLGFLKPIYRPLIYVGTANAATWTAAGTTAIELFAIIAADYTSGNVTVNVFRRAVVGTNTVVMRRSSYRFRDATALNNYESAANINMVAPGTNDLLLSWSVSSSNFQAGDILRFDISRLGDDVGDTNTSDVSFDGGYITYG